MKMRYTLIYSLILGMVLMTACNDKEDEVNPVESQLPPGPEYVKEGNYCLNAVCYFSKGEDTLANWHAIYSGYLKQIQAEFREQMELCGYPDKTFNLELNKQNPAYVNIIRLEGQVDSVSEKGVQVITEAVSEYFTLHPEEKKSDFTMIFAPNSSISGTVLNLAGDHPGGMMVTAYTDGTLSSGQLGICMCGLGKIFFLPDSSEPFTGVYYSMMNKEYGFNNWGVSSRLMKADAMWLNQHQIFNHKTKVYYSEKPEVKVNHTDLKFQNNLIEVTCEFTSSQNIVGVIVYNDPWSYPDRKYEILNNDYTTGDAIPYATDQVNKNGSGYRITVQIPWDDLPATYKVPEANEVIREAEIRFRFLVEDGMAVPMYYKGNIHSGYRYPYVIKNYIPDFDTPVDVEVETNPEPEN